MAEPQIRRNYFLNLTYQVVSILASLVTVPYISRVLQPEGVGAYSFADSICYYFVLFAAFGTSLYGQREVSYAQNDVQARSAAFWNVMAFRMVSSALSYAAFVVFAQFQADTFLYMLLSMQVIASAFDVAWFFQGMENFSVIVVRNLVIRLACLAFIFIAVRGPQDFYLYVAGMSVAPLISTAWLLPLLRRYVRPPVLAELHPFRDTRTIVELFAPAVLVSIYSVLDKTMIGILVEGSAENGYYHQAMSVARIVLTVVTAMGAVMAPRVGKHFAAGEADTMREYIYKSYRFVWMIGVPLCLGLAACASNFVPWFFGPGYDKVTPLLWILSFLVLVIGISDVTGTQYLVPTKRQNMATLTVMGGAALNVVLNLILIPQLQSVGAAIASLAAEVLVACAQLLLLRRELSAARILGQAWKYVAAGLCMLAALLALGAALDSSIPHTLAMVAVGVAVYAGMLALLRDDFFLDNARLVMRNVTGKARRK